MIPLGKNLQLLTVVLETFFPKSSGNVLKSICNETQFKDQSFKVAYNFRQMKSLENLIKLLEVNRDITDGYFVLEMFWIYCYLFGNVSELSSAKQNLFIDVIQVLAESIGKLRGRKYLLDSIVITNQLLSMKFYTRWV